MFHSIRWRIAIPYVLLILITMIGLGAYLSYFTRQTYIHNLETQLFGQARLMADELSNSPEAWSNPERLNALAKRWGSLLEARITLIRPDGTVLGESHEDPAQMDNHLNRPEIQQALATGQGSSTRFSQTVGFQMMYVAVRVNSENSTLGFVRVAVPLQQVQENTAHLQRTFMGVTLVVTLLAVLLATIIANRTTRPLLELTAAARSMSTGELDARLEPTTTDEVGQLTEAFNRMAVQQQAQIQALEAEGSKLAAVLHEMTDGVVIVDIYGQVQLMNPAAEKIFSVERQAALGRSLAEVLRHHQFVELWQHCRETNEPQTTTVEISANRLYLQGVATPLGKSMPGSTLLVFQNLSRLRQLETIRRDFISNISHELRTPLASLKALAETLQEGALEDPPAARRFLQRMETEVDALSQMVSELLELSRIESGRVPLRLSPASPHEILASAVERLHLQAERSGISVTIESPSDLPQVLADQPRLEQVVVNLLHNAIKFTPAGGNITLKAEQHNGSVVFSVSDTGSGIPAADLPRIFERFFKADRARSSGGTGLGLAIARHMVEAHGGKIWARSQEGQGSTFYFSIPLAH